MTDLPAFIATVSGDRRWLLIMILIDGVRVNFDRKSQLFDVMMDDEQYAPMYRKP